MQKSLLLITLFALINLLQTFTCQAQTTEKIKIVFGTRSHRMGDGCGGNKGLCIFLNVQRPAGTDEGLAEIWIEEEQFVINILEDQSPAMEDENTFHIYEPKEVPSEICKELGYDRIVLQPGEYRLDKNRNPLGKTIVKAVFQ